MSVWQAALLANASIALAYAALAITILRGVHRSGQWRSNPLAVTTGVILLSCAAGYASHLQHLLMPSTADEARVIWDWPLTAIHATTAILAVRYWMLRGRIGALLRSPVVFEDVATRRREAYDIQDGLVQHLATAKMALELGDTRVGMRELDAALARSRQLMSDRHGLASEFGVGARPGDLRREVAGP